MRRRQPWGLGKPWEMLRPFIEAVVGKQATQLATVAPAQPAPLRRHVASYAKQAGDDSLRKHADRIQARAIQRCGELLKAIEPKHTGRPAKELVSAPAAIQPPTRKEAAQAAGLSHRQHHTALRVANVPKHDFDAAVESDDPPTVTQLAERGKKPAPPKGADRHATPWRFAPTTQSDVARMQPHDLISNVSRYPPTGRGICPQP